ncbi:hypothetical protein O9993_02255 [Vibrio lentus]|nr:hypothetical protein [Vibrio lentus]
MPKHSLSFWGVAWAFVPVNCGAISARLIGK